MQKSRLYTTIYLKIGIIILYSRVNRNTITARYADTKYHQKKPTIIILQLG